MKTTKITIEVSIEHKAGSSQDVLDLVDLVLDHGDFQDEINNRGSTEVGEEGSVRVASVMTTSYVEET
jgi:hypothetical protein